MRPKGTSGNKVTPGQEHKEGFEPNKHGDKRIWAQNPEEKRPEKRRRVKSTGPGDSKWMGKPTFLTE